MRLHGICRLIRFVSVAQILAHRIAQRLPADTEVIPCGRLNVLVTGEFFYERDVSAVVAKISAVGMPQNMRRQLFVDPGLPLEFFEVFGEIVAIPAPRNASCYKDSWEIIGTEMQEPTDPADCSFRKEDSAPLAAFSDNVDLRDAHLKRSTV